jgi:hypothetical protein
MLKSDAGCVGVSVETFHWLKTEKNACYSLWNRNGKQEQTLFLDAINLRTRINIFGRVKC